MIAILPDNVKTRLSAPLPAATLLQSGGHSIISAVLYVKEDITIAPGCKHMAAVCGICQANAITPDLASVLWNHLLSVVDIY